MTTPYEFIALTATEAAAQGGSVRTSCPWCHGGATKEQSFVVSATKGRVAYHCFRAGCTGPSSGYLNAGGTGLYRNPIRHKPKPKEFDWETYPPSDGLETYLFRRYALSSDMCSYYGIKASKNNDIVVPCYSDTGIMQGTVVRLREPKKTKVLTYHGAASDGLAWYNSTPPHADELFDGHRLWVVEDVFSAMRVNEYTHSLALLGTHLSPEQAHKIGLKGYRQVALALDADASGKAVKLCRKYRHIIGRALCVVFLKQDIKDMSTNEVADLIRSNV